MMMMMMKLCGFCCPLQQVLLSISSTISIPLIVSGNICADELTLVKSEIMSTFLFMCGVCTILQVLIGVRSVSLWLPQLLRPPPRVEYMF